MCCCVVVQRLIEEENMLAPSLQQFSLRTEMLPSYIPIRVAEKILFVGESVQMFENHNHSPSRAGSEVLCSRTFVLMSVRESATLLYVGFRLHTEAPGGHVRCRAAQTQTATSFQLGGF